MGDSSIRTEPAPHNSIRTEGDSEIIGQSSNGWALEFPQHEEKQIYGSWKARLGTRHKL
jgi:hypothetical protein